ncbi:MAG TPA: carboxypeptidase-like regulatory domain-containing protein, partial [Opitutales bacterium]|nr:carboxypeptidase-like regulatory domain-containing protein [Opitutales bacterium]
TITPSFTITPSSVPADYTGNIVLNITGLTSGEQVRFTRFQDANHDGNGDISDPLVNDFTVKDGATTAFGGVTDPIIPADDDGLQDGNISTHITLPASAEMGRVSGNYVITVTSTNSNRNFIPITQILTVTQPASYVQSVSGQVFDTNNNPIGFSKVALLSQGNNGDSQFIVGTLTDSNGNFTLAAPVGSYLLVAFKQGYVTASPIRHPHRQPNLNRTKPYHGCRHFHDHWQHG